MNDINTNNNININMNSTHLTKSTSVINPKTRKYRAYDLVKERMVSFSDPYGKAAKRLYKQYIDIAKYDPEMVVPSDLKYYPDSGRFLKFKPKKEKPPYLEVEEKTSFKKYLATYSIANKLNIQAYAGVDLMLNFKPQLLSMLNLHNGIKFYFDLQCLMVKYLDGEIITQDTRWISSRRVSATNKDELFAKLQSSIDLIKQKIPDLEARNGSMWIFKKVLTLDLHIGRYQPLKGSSYVALPEKLKLKNAIINVQNDDNKCFKWAILSALHPPSCKPYRVSKYKNIDHNLKFPQFPTPISDIHKFERDNNISVNLYGENYLLQKSTHISETHVDLLLYKGHYSWIKSFSRFCGTFRTHGKQHTHYCKHCLQGYTSEKLLERHISMGCAEITTCRPCMPHKCDATCASASDFGHVCRKKDEAFVEFKNTQNQIKAPFVIYSDFECLTKPIHKCSTDPKHSSTQAYQNHEPSGYTVHVTGMDRKPIEYRGKNCVNKFIEVIKGLEKEILAKVDSNCPMKPLTNGQKWDFNDPDGLCHFCKKPCGDDRVRDHDHITGEYRGMAHNKCNLEEGKKNTRNYKIPVVFHNLKNYDGHLIIQNVGEHTSKISVIPQNYEKYISFSFDHFKFIDSAAFLASSLDNLASNLLNGGKHKFKESLKYGPKENIDLLLKKGVFPYDYMTDWGVFDETKLPPIENFYSKLSNSDISKEDYVHAKNVWNTFNIKNIGEYQDLYCTTDVLLLADIFENFRDLSIEDYGLDPVHYYTLPGYAWDCMLKLTKVKLDLLTDYDMHMMIESGIRGGISMIAHRYAKNSGMHTTGHLIWSIAVRTAEIRLNAFNVGGEVCYTHASLASLIRRKPRRYIAK
jgi:hypothetical protein